MTIYLHYRGLFAIYIEINYRLGGSPYFLTKKYKTETIIQLPFTTIIFTPRHKAIGQTDEIDETGHRNIHKTPA